METKAETKQKTDQNTEQDKQTQEETDPFVEKDGEIYIKTEQEETESPAESPDDKQTDSDKEPSKEENSQPEKSEKTSGQDEADKQEVETQSETDEQDEIPEKYKGKTPQELIKMHTEATKKISQQGQELNKYKKTVDTQNLSPEEIKKNLSSENLKQAFTNEKQKLNQLSDQLNSLDEFDDPDKVQKLRKQIVDQRSVVDQLQLDWQEKLHREEIERKFTSQENQQTIAQKKEEFAEKYDIKGDDFQDITERAKNFTKTGKLNDKAYHHAMVDKYGLEKVMKYNQIEAEQKARQEIIDADGKVQEEKIHPTSSGKNAKLIRWNDMSTTEKRKHLKNMDSDEIDKLYSRLRK